MMGLSFLTHQSEIHPKVNTGEFFLFVAIFGQRWRFVAQPNTATMERYKLRGMGLGCFSLQNSV
jgi:hypothetical protein